MKTMEELFQEVLGSDGLKGAFAQAVSEGRMEEFLKEHGCEASPEEVKAFLQEKQAKEGELSEAELDVVSGGCDTMEASVTAVPDPSEVTINIC